MNVLGSGHTKYYKPYRDQTTELNLKSPSNIHSIRTMYLCDFKNKAKTDIIHIICLTWNSALAVYT